MGKIVRMRSTDGFLLASAIDSTDIVAEASRIHDTSATASAALGRALSITSLIGKTIKADGGSVTLQFSGGGPGGSLITVSDTGGNVRGYIQHPNADVARKPNGKLDVGGLVGNDGILTVIKDLRIGEPYIGAVALKSGEIAEDVAAYFAESEQIPTVCAAGVLVNPDNSIQCSGAYLLQLMPGYGEHTIERLERQMQKAEAVTVMLHNGISPEDMLRTVASEEELIMLEELSVEYRCYCSKERVTGALVSIGAEDLRSMISEQGSAEVTCQFCDRVYAFSKDDLTEMLRFALNNQAK